MAKINFKNLLKEENDKINISQSERLRQTKLSQKIDNQIEKKQSKNLLFWQKYKVAFVASISMILLVAICLLTIITGLPQSGTQVSTLTSYIIDINPSLCVTTDSTSDTIVSVYSLNDDGDIILSDSEMNKIVGQNLFSGMRKIMKIVEDNNFINMVDEKIINIYAVNDNPEFAKRKADKLGNDMFDYFFDKGMGNINVNHEQMGRDDFRNRIGFNENHRRIEDMAGDVMDHEKFHKDDPFNPMPPPEGNNENLPEKPADELPPHNPSEEPMPPNSSEES